MKCNRNSGSVLAAGSQCLGHTCGTNINTEGIDFTEPQSNLVYMDKVFSFNEDTSNPILFNLNTGGNNAGNFITELTLFGQERSLIPCTLGPNAVFTIDNTFVAVEYFNTRPPGSINATQVTLDGFNVDSVSFSNGQYTARTANVLPRIQKERCLERGLPTKAFFLINNAGPWDFRAKFVLEGTVNTNGRICRFRAIISNAPNSANISLPPGNLSSFAIPNLSLPCSINGIAPDILFQFDAKINLVNPRLVVNCGTPTTTASASITDNTQKSFVPCQPCPEILSIASCTASLVTTLAVEPRVHVETVRRTLFCVNACEGLQPCQGSLVAAAEEDNEEECEIGGVDRPDCRCGNDRGSDDRGSDDISSDDRGSNNRCRNGSVAGTRTCNRRNNTEVESTACGNFDVGGLTAGVGTCEDCNFGDENLVGGARDRRRRHRDRDRDEVEGIRDCEDVLGELCENLLGESTCCNDVAGVSGLAPNGTFGCDCNEVREAAREREKGQQSNNRVRTAFQFNGCNGCSW